MQASNLRPANYLIDYEWRDVGDTKNGSENQSNTIYKLYNCTFKFWIFE